MSEIKYLDYEGLLFFKNKLDVQRIGDKSEIVALLNELNNSINNGTLTIQKNGVTVATFGANQSSNTTINLEIPTLIGDLTNSTLYIQNIIQYGQPDVSELTEEQKEALHELSAENSGLISESELEEALADYGTIINYDSARQYILLKHGSTVLSEFSAADFIKDNMIESVSVSNGNLVMTFNTESGLEDITLPISDIFNANNYYTKSELASVATTGAYSSLTGIPGTLTLNDINTGTDTTGKLITAKVIKDSINNALYGQGGASGTVITSDNLTTQVLSAGFAKSIMTAPNTTYNADSNGVIYLPTLKEDDIKNIIKYGQADISGMTAEERAQAEEDNGYVKSSDLATVATSGSYNDLSNKPTLFSGSYNDLTNKPAIPNALILSDWNQTNSTSLDYIKNKPTIYSQLEIQNIIQYGLADVSGMSEAEKEAAQDLSNYALKSDLFSRNYNDLTNKPNIPTSVSQLTNDLGYLTSHLDISGKVNTSDLATVATTGSYNDLTDKPTIPTVDITKAYADNTYQLKGNYLTSHLDISGKVNYTDLAIVATSGDYNDLINKPTIPSLSGYATLQWVGQLGYLTSHQDISGKANTSDLATVATTGNYNDLSNKPTIPSLNGYATQQWVEQKGYLTSHQDISGKANTSDLATVATSGSYNDLLNKPTIPSLTGYATQLWVGLQGYLTQHLDISGKANSNDLATVATSGSYNDLSNKPTIISDYNGLSYTGSSITSEGGAVTVNGLINVIKITASASISGIILSAIPENYHSCHIIVMSSAAEDISVLISNGATITIDEVGYTLVCPDDSDISLSLSSGKYIEFDILRIGTELFVRGV